MPAGNRNGDTQAGIAGQERPVIFQKYFKSGSRTYASQIKIASNGKKYLVLTEGVRDNQTQEVKKHILRVFESDLKEFFAMMQETVVYLRTNKDVKDPGNTVAGVAVAKPAVQPLAAVTKPGVTKPIVAPKAPPARPVPQPKPLTTSKPAIPAKPIAKAPAPRNGVGNGKSVTPVPAARSAKAVIRPANRSR